MFRNIIIKTIKISSATLVVLAIIMPLSVRASATFIFLTDTAATTWTVPANWTSDRNTIEVIGGGAMGTTFSNGGGGGAYSKITNQSLTPGTNIGIKVGDGGTGGGDGGDTWLCNSTSNCATIGGSAVIIGAKGGSSGGSGGAAASGVGSTKYSGGDGGSDGGAGGCAGGGGGAAGPNGNGANGGAGNGVTSAGGGGGGGGGSAGVSGPGGSNGGAGGNNYLGTGGGAGGTFTNPGTSGTAGGGGGAAGYAGGSGGTGGTGQEWDSTHGSGGGGGGTPQSSGGAGAGGLYGGGGTGGGYQCSGAAGAQGIIVITYYPKNVVSKPPNNLGLIGYWSFNEGSATIAHDFSGNSNNGTLTDGPSWTSGKRSVALDFDGTNDYVTAPHSSSLNISTGGEVTMCAWVYPRSYSGYESIISKRDDSLGSPYAYGINFNSTDFQVYTSGSSGVQAFTYSLPLNAWTHFCGTISASPTKLFINGDLFGSLGSGGGVISNTAAFYIGATKLGSIAEFFPGKIDEVRVYNRALSANEVAVLYRTGAAKMGGHETTRITESLVGYWPFNGRDVNWTSSSGGTVYDRAGTFNGSFGGLNQETSVIRGKMGQGIYLSGQYIDVGSNAALNPANFTISAWVKPGDFSGNYNYIYSNSRDCCGTENGINVAIKANKLNTQIWNGGVSEDLTSTGSVSSDWTHVATTYDGSTIRLYLNGVLDSSENTALGVGTGPNYTTLIGCLAYIPPNFCGNGNFDDIRLYNRALSAPEIKQLYLLGNVKIKI